MLFDAHLPRFREAFQAQASRCELLTQQLQVPQLLGLEAWLDWQDYPYINIRQNRRYKSLRIITTITIAIITIILW